MAKQTDTKTARQKYIEISYKNAAFLRFCYLMYCKTL